MSVVSHSVKKCYVSCVGWYHVEWDECKIRAGIISSLLKYRTSMPISTLQSCTIANFKSTGNLR